MGPPFPQSQAPPISLSSLLYDNSYRVLILEFEVMRMKQLPDEHRT